MVKELEISRQQTMTGENIGIPRELYGRKGKIRWSALRGDPTRLMEILVTEAKSFFHQEGQLTQQLLYQRKQASLSHAITRYYPGGMVQLKEDIGIASSIKPAGYWTAEVVEAEVRRVYQDQGKLTRGVIKTTAGPALEAAIGRNFGGLNELKSRLGIDSDAKPSGYWTKEKIEAEAREFFEQGGKLDQGSLSQQNRSDLVHAITRYYPGRLRGLRRTLELDNKPDKVVNKQWTPEIIEGEASGFIQVGGILAYRVLFEQKRGDLAVAIRYRYQGGIKALKEKLQVRQNIPSSYWTKERVEEAAMGVYQREHRLTMPLLVSQKNYPLAEAIRRLYPGGMRGLKTNLGLDLRTKPKGYWTTERIEQEATGFLLKVGGISYPLLIKYKRIDLMSALSYYPGRLSALKEKLGISNGEKEPVISPEQANEQLRRLLEVEG